MSDSSVELIKQSRNLIQALTLELERRDELLEAAAPKVGFYDRVTESGDWKDMGEVAKILGPFGRNKLFAVLRDMRVLRHNNQPYQQYVDRGYFRLVEVDKTDSYGTTRVIAKTVVSQKGIEWIGAQLEEMN